MIDNLQKAFATSPICIPFLVAGYPSEDLFVDIVLLLAEKGCPLIEIGFPFSDPIADGSVIQRASQKVLDNGMNVQRAFKLIKKIRRKSQVSLAVMTYFNIVFFQTLRFFVQRCCEEGIDALIIPDMIVEESDCLSSLCQDRLGLIFFLSASTALERRKKIFSKTTGFLYCLSRMGVTGNEGALDLVKITHWLKSLKKETQKPLAVGFGLSDPQDIKILSEFADGIIIGSALISCIHEEESSIKNLQRVSDFISPILEVLK